MVWRATALNSHIRGHPQEKQMALRCHRRRRRGRGEGEGAAARFWNADYEGLAANDQPSYEAGERDNKRQHITTAKASTRSAAKRPPVAVLNYEPRFAPIPVQGDSPAGPSFRGGLTNSATISRSKRETPATRRLPPAPPPGKGHLPDCR
jgi:hypothetical protein